METARKALSRGPPCSPPQVCKERHVCLQLNLDKCLLIPVSGVDRKVRGVFTQSSRPVPHIPPQGTLSPLMLSQQPRPKLVWG